MTLSSFHAAPRIGHLARTKRIIGYLAKMKHACIRFRVEQPGYSDLPIPVYDWSSSVYNDLKEILPTDAPTPLGNKVVTTHNTDASLMHDMLTGKSVTAILHFVNKTPVDWYSKKQATVETATYESVTWVFQSKTDATCLAIMSLSSTVQPYHMENYIHGISCCLSIVCERLLLQV